MATEAPEFDSAMALEIVRKHQILDEEAYLKETDEKFPYNEDYTVENGYLSNRKDRYVVANENEKVELKRALTRLFEANSVHYKRRIVVEN